MSYRDTLDLIDSPLKTEFTGGFWQLPIDHFSASSLEMAEVCPEQWRLRYILGRKEPPGQAKVVGTLAHRGIEFGLTEKLLTGNDPDLQDMVTYYQDAVWPQVLDSYGGEQEIIWDQKPEEVRNSASRMIAAYHPTIPLLWPQEIEYGFLLDIGYPIPVMGFIDLIQANDRPSIDWKTSNKRLSTAKSKWLVQGRVYQLVIPRQIDWHIITKAKTPAVQTPLEVDGLSEYPSHGKAQNTVSRLADSLDMLNALYIQRGPDEAWPERGIFHDWRCGWCAWKKECGAWA